MKRLDTFRDAVIRTAQIGKHKLEATFLRRERDQLVLRLGEAAYQLLQLGDLPLHPRLTDALRALQSLDEKLAAEEREVQAIENERAEAQTAG